MIRVVIADDHHVVRTGLEQLLSTFDDVEVVGTASGGEEAVTICAAERPDVALLDLAMPDVDGIEATRRILAGSPDTKVIVFTSFSDRDRIVGALDAGAVGLPAEGRRARRAASRHRGRDAGRSSVASSRRRTAARRPTTHAPTERLSTREREVWSWSREGRPTNRSPASSGSARRR